MGFRFNNREQQSVEDIFDRLIQPEKVADDYEETDEKSLSALPLTPEFIREYTSFGSYADFVLKSPVDLRQHESDLSDKQLQTLDHYIATHSDYASYQELKAAAMREK
ncbi:MAG: hypothetical protein MR008_03680 [Aerococcus sp.]|nr:hypothetical protein [Aerococcus sp.]